MPEQSTRAIQRDNHATASTREEIATYQLTVAPDHEDAPTEEDAIRDVGFDPDRSVVVDNDAYETMDGWEVSFVVWEVQS